MDQLRSIFGRGSDLQADDKPPRQPSCTLLQLADKKQLRQIAGDTLNKDVSGRSEALAMLLCAARGGHDGMVELCRMPGFLQGLVDIVGTEVDAKASFSSAPAEVESLDADITHAIVTRENATLLLWQLSCCPSIPSVIVSEAPACLHMLLGLVVDKNVSIRAAASGVLLNLSQLPEVAAQLSRHSDLITLLVGMLANAEKKPLFAAASNSETRTFQELVVMAHVHAAGLLAVLASNPACTVLIAAAENLPAKLFQGLCFEAPAAELHDSARQLRQNCSDVVQHILMQSKEQPDSCNELLSSLLKLVVHADAAAAYAFTSSTAVHALHAVVNQALQAVLPGSGASKPNSVTPAAVNTAFELEAASERQSSHANDSLERTRSDDQKLQHMQNGVLAVQILKVLVSWSNCLDDLTVQSSLWDKLHTLAFLAPSPEQQATTPAGIRRAAAQLQGCAAGIIATASGFKAFRNSAAAPVSLSATSAELKAAVQFLVLHQPHPVEEASPHFNYMAGLLAAVCAGRADSAAITVQLFLSTPGALGALLSLLSPSNTQAPADPINAATRKPLLSTASLPPSLTTSQPPTLSRFGRSVSLLNRHTQLPSLPYPRTSDSSQEFPAPLLAPPLGRTSSKEVPAQESKDLSAVQLSTSISLDNAELLQAILVVQQEVVGVAADAASMGLAAALQLLQVTCQNADLAKIIATKTDLISILLKKLCQPVNASTTFVRKSSALEAVDDRRQGLRSAEFTTSISSQSEAECLLARTLQCLALVLDEPTLISTLVQDQLLVPALVTGLGSQDATCRTQVATLVASMCGISQFQSLLTSAREGQEVMRLLVEQLGSATSPAGWSTQGDQLSPAASPAALAVAKLTSGHWPAAVMLGNMSGTLETLSARLSQALLSISENGYRLPPSAARLILDVTHTLATLAAAAPTVASSLAVIPGIASTMTDCIDFMLGVMEDLPTPTFRSAFRKRSTTSESVALFSIPENTTAAMEVPGAGQDAVVGAAVGGSLVAVAADVDVGASKNSEQLHHLAQEVRIYAVRTLRHLVAHWARKSGKALEFEDVPTIPEEEGPPAAPQPPPSVTDSIDSAGELLHRPSSLELKQLEVGMAPAMESQSLTKQLQLVAQVCCKVLTTYEHPKLRAECTKCLHALLGINHRLAAYITQRVPQLLDRILDMMLATNPSASAKPHDAPSHAAPSLGPTPATSAFANCPPAYADDIHLVAEAGLAALDTVKLLCGNQLVVPRVAAHPKLPLALDALLDENSYYQMKALFSTVRLAKIAETPGEMDTDMYSAHRLSSAGTRLSTPSSRLSSAGTRLSTPSSRTGTALGTAKAGSPGPPTELQDSCPAAAEVVILVAPHMTRPLLSSAGGVLHALEMLIRQRDAPRRFLGLRATWALATTPGGADLLCSSSSGILKCLVALLKAQDASLRISAASVVACLAQHLQKLPALGSVDGLAPALVDLAAAATEVLLHRLASSMSADASSSELPDPVVLENAQLQLVWSLAAISVLAQSPVIAARLATFKNLPTALTAALKCRGQEVSLFAAVAVANLTSHTASQGVMTSCRVGRELVQISRMPGSVEVLDAATGALRNLASFDKGRQDLASDPLTILTLMHLVSDPLRPFTPAATHAQYPPPSSTLPPQRLPGLQGGSATQPGEAIEKVESARLKAAAALANLSTDRIGQEAMVTEHELVIPGLFALLQDPAPLSPVLTCFISVSLCNALSHSVLSRAALLHPPAIPTLTKLISSIPSYPAPPPPPPPLRPTTPQPLQPPQPPSAAEKLIRSRVTRLTTVCHLQSLRLLLTHCGERVMAGPGALALIPKLLDLLRYADAAETQAHSASGAGAEVAAAAAGVVAQLAINGLADHLSGHESHVTHVLMKLLVLASCERPPDPTGQLQQEGAAQVLDHAAAHAAMALWALTTNPLGEPWAVRVAADAAVMQVLLLMVERAQTGGTRARFNPGRLLCALVLGQLTVQGLVGAALSPLLVQRRQGVIGALVDLLPLAHSLVAAPRPSATGTKSKAPEPDYQDSARTAAMTLVGIGPDLRLTVALQAAGALAHLAALPDGAKAIAETPHAISQLVKLLRLPVGEVRLVAVMALSVISSAGEAVCKAMGRDHHLIADLVSLLPSSQPQLQAYAATALGNIALEDSAASRIAMPDTIKQLAQLLCSFHTQPDKGGAGAAASSSGRGPTAGVGRPSLGAEEPGPLWQSLGGVEQMGLDNQLRTTSTTRSPFPKPKALPTNKIMPLPSNPSTTGPVSLRTNSTSGPAQLRRAAGQQALLASSMDPSYTTPATASQAAAAIDQSAAVCSAAAGCLANLAASSAHHPAALDPAVALLDSLLQCLQHHLHTALAPPLSGTPAVTSSAHTSPPTAGTPASSAVLVLQYLLNICANLAASEAGRLELSQRPLLLQALLRCLCPQLPSLLLPTLGALSNLLAHPAPTSSTSSLLPASRSRTSTHMTTPPTAMSSTPSTTPADSPPPIHPTQVPVSPLSSVLAHQQSRSAILPLVLCSAHVESAAATAASGPAGSSQPNAVAAVAEAVAAAVVGSPDALQFLQVLQCHQTCGSSSSGSTNTDGSGAAMRYARWVLQRCREVDGSVT